MYPRGEGTETLAPAHRRRFGKRALIALLAVLLVLGAAGGVAGWWFGSGRFSTVPKLTGMTVAQAKRALAAENLHATVHKAHNDTVPEGKVVSSDPTPGADVLHGGQVSLLASSGRPVVPNIPPGTNLAAARRAISDADLTPKSGKKVYSTSVPAGDVVSVSPGPGARLDVDANVTIVVSKGPPPKPVPDVTGMSRKQAFRSLSRLGLQPYVKGKKFSPDAKEGTVVATDPPAGTKLGSGEAKRVGVVLSNAVTVPNVIGHTVAKATKALRDAGLKVEVHQFGGHHPHGRVLIQSQPPGTRVKPGTKVTLTAFP
jgi:serine/threonine-protein kinase